MISWREFDKRFCVSCLYAVAVSSAIAVSGDWLMALFVFATTSVLIAGWKSDDDALFTLAMLIFMGWVVNTVVYFFMQKLTGLEFGPITINSLTVIYFFAATVHWGVAILALNNNQVWVSSLAALMGATALVGLFTREVMPWRAIGNVTFLFQCVFFIGVCLLVIRSKRNKPQTKSSGQVLKFGASHGRSVAGVR